MATVSYQTIKLGKGRHRSPEDGACVMELASMLAGESFSDRPASVCPIIAGLLRAYNDSVDDKRRQDLYRYAATVVGSRASQSVKEARARRLEAWIEEVRPTRPRRNRLFRLLSALTPQAPADCIGAAAIHAIPKIDDRTHPRVLALMDELLELDDRPAGTGRPALSDTPHGFTSDRGRASIPDC